MSEARIFVGLDVHAAETVAAVLDAETGELRVARLPGRNATGGRALCAAHVAPIKATAVT
jgi:hypothetical protein